MYFFFSSRRRHTRCSRDWSSDVCSSDLYDGVVVTRGRRGERSIAAAEFFLGPLMTALAADELLVETRWPVPTPGTGWGLHEVARRHGDFALVGAAALVTLSDGKVARARVAVFGCGATPTLAAVEAALAGCAPTTALIDEAARTAASALDPPADLHASVEYRSEEHTSELQSRLHLVCR